MQILILVHGGPHCSTKLATCNFSENELIAKFARVLTSLKLPVITYTVHRHLYTFFSFARA